MKPIGQQTNPKIKIKRGVLYCTGIITKTMVCLMICHVQSKGMGIYVKVSIMSCVEYILTNYGMAQKQYSVSLKCCYTVGAFPIRQIYCVNTRNNYFIVFYYQFGVNVFCHDDNLKCEVYSVQQCVEIQQLLVMKLKTTKAQWKT